MIIMKKKYLNNATYIKSLLQEYPELKRLLELKNNSIQRAECEIRKSLYAEKEQIQKIFCDGRKFSGTVGIYNVERRYTQRRTKCGKGRIG